jgi:hypothetical protein
MTHDLGFLFDVDTTLLDNDRRAADWRHHLAHDFRAAAAERSFAIFEELRAEFGYPTSLGALQRFRLEHPPDTHLLRISASLVEYPFANRLFPGALAPIAHVQQWGPAAVLSEGEVVVERCYPATHDVLIDHEIRRLTAGKAVWGQRLTKVFPRQGHDALDALTVAQSLPADLTIEHLGDLVDYDRDTLLGRRRHAAPAQREGTEGS